MRLSIFGQEKGRFTESNMPFCSKRKAVSLDDTLGRHILRFSYGSSLFFLSKIKFKKNNLEMSVKHFIFAVILCQRNASESLELSRNCESERISQSICHKIPREWEITRGR